MKASEAYQEYCAIKAHFERPSYDYFKYNGKVRAGNYEKRNDKHVFFRLSRAFNKVTLQEYLLANQLADQRYVMNFTKENWLEWKKKIVRLHDVYTKDLEVIVALMKERNLTAKEVFKVNSGEHPIFFRLLLGGFIQIETFVIMNMVASFISVYDSKMEDDPTWNQWSLKVKKYSPFLVKKLDSSWNFKELTKRILLNTN